MIKKTTGDSHSNFNFSPKLPNGVKLEDLPEFMQQHYREKAAGLMNKPSLPIEQFTTNSNAFIKDLSSESKLSEIQTKTGKFLHTLKEDLKSFMPPEGAINLLDQHESEPVKKIY